MHPDKDLQLIYITEVTKKDIMGGLQKSVDDYKSKAVKFNFRPGVLDQEDLISGKFIPQLPPNVSGLTIPYFFKDNKDTVYSVHPTVKEFYDKLFSRVNIDEDLSDEYFTLVQDAYREVYGEPAPNY